MRAITIKRTVHYFENEARAGFDEPCVRCGKGVNPDLTARVHMNTDWQAVPVNAVLADNDSQGWHAIGPDCARTIPAAYVLR